MFPRLLAILFRIGFYVSAAIILPYSLWVFLQEYQSFSRIPVALGLLTLSVLTFLLYFSCSLRFHFHVSWNQAIVVTVLLIVLGIGFLTVLSIIAFAYFCETINHFREKRVGQRMSVRPIWGMVCLGLTVLFVYPLLNAMYFRGTTADYVHPDYNQQNFFFEINGDGFRGPPVSVERSDQPRLMFLGDSTAFGWPYRHSDAYPLFSAGRIASAWNCGCRVDQRWDDRPGRI